MELKNLCKIIELLENTNQNTNQNAGDKGPWEIGKKYFIRTVTLYYTGELINVFQQELVIKDAAWIADSGRFNEVLKDPNKCKEAEPFVNNVIIGRGAIIDATEISDVITEIK